MTIFLFSFLISTSPVSRDTSIRTTDWKQFFISDTANYEVHTDVNDNRWGDLFISLKQFEEGSLAYGFPMLDYMTFGDIDGDNVEEAVIEFYTGGSIGSCSYIILKKTQNDVRTIFQEAHCYRYGRIENDTLNIYQIYPTGYDYDRMAQSATKLSYRLDGSSFIFLDSQAYGHVRFADNAVKQFYKRLHMKEYEAAYTLLSPSYRQLHPYEKWLRGYSNTDSTDAVVSYANETDTTVAVDITSIDIVDGKTMVAKYAGTWKLIWSGLDEGWLLDEPKIRKVR